MLEDQEFFQIFCAESRELIDSVEPKLIELHEASDLSGSVDPELINTVFRLFHSVKGSGASLGLENITQATHGAESLLDLFRSGKAKLAPEHIELFLKTIDLTRLYLDEVEATCKDSGHEEERNALVEALTQAYETARGGKKALAASPPEKPAGKIVIDLGELSPSAASEPPLYARASSAKLVERFVSESTELLDQAEKSFLEMTKSPDNARSLMRDILGNVHGLKGNSGFMGFSGIERLSHQFETSLEAFLDMGTLDFQKTPAPEDIVTFLMVIDSLRKGVEDVAAGGIGAFDGEDVMKGFLAKILSSVKPESEKPFPQPIGEILIEKGAVTEEDVQIALKKQKIPVGEILVGQGKIPPETLNEALKTQKDQQTFANEGVGPGKWAGKKDIRVDLRKLDHLVNLVGELVIAESMVTRNPELQGLQLESFERAAHHLRRVTNEIQDVAMSVRMVPLAATFQKLLRAVHDISQKEGKKIKLELIGEETEVDKTMTEQIADPLLHMVRNSVDHGIEKPPDRLAAGKPETGNIRVEGRHEGGEVWIIISDDGKGLSRDRILAKGVERGIVKGDGSGMSDEEVFQLIFEPGLSTAEKITEVSGRGVGMDVVKKNIEKLKGRITVRSDPGKGTTIILHIPLTLAIIEGMLVKVAESSYTLPILSIRESLRPKEEAITVTPDGTEVIRVREELIPVIRLHEVFRKNPVFSRLHDGIIVIVEDQGRSVALFVDELLGQQQTVIKGLPIYLSSVHGVSGCTILGDGSISLILDVGKIINRAEL